MKKLWALLIIFLSLFSTQTFATCARQSTTNTSDGATAIINFGTVNLASAYLQPVGTLLSSIVVPPTNFTYNNVTASSVLWICDVTDLPNMQFLVATNGDDRVGGFYDLGATDGIPDTYATYFQYVGLRQKMGGITVTRYWQAIPITTYEIVGSKVHIRLQDIPPLYAELYRVSQLAPNAAASNFCGTQVSSGSYTCMQPNAYIQLQGPGLTGDKPGQDSAYNFLFWGAYNGFGYSMRSANTLSQVSTCVARSATPLVTFKSMGIDELNNNQSTQANFNVAIECSNGVNSGTNSKQTAIGLQVSSGALAAARNLGLVNANSGVSALLSDNYGAADIAKGVGIYLSNTNTGENMIFVGQSNVNSGALSGWYPVLSGAQNSGSTESGYTHYIHTFTATLKKITGISDSVEAGKVKSTAYVLVRVQ